MKYCQDCGNPHECAAETVSNVEAEETKRVRIQADRDIRIAEVQAGAAKVIAEVEAESEADHLEGVIEGVELVAGDAEPDADDTTVPTIVVQGDDPGAEETTDVEEPPEVTSIPEPAKSGGGGYWGGYR
jgi:hypothetical protein